MKCHCKVKRKVKRKTKRKKRTRVKPLKSTPSQTIPPLVRLLSNGIETKNQSTQTSIETKNKSTQIRKRRKKSM